MSPSAGGRPPSPRVWRASVRICFVIPTLTSGGAERVAVTVLGALDGQRHTRVLYLFSSDDAVYLDRVAPGIRNAGVVPGCGGLFLGHAIHVHRTKHTVVALDSADVEGGEYRARSKVTDAIVPVLDALGKDRRQPLRHRPRWRSGGSSRSSSPTSWATRPSPRAATSRTSASSSRATSGPPGASASAKGGSGENF